MILYTAGPADGRHQDNYLLHESRLASHILPGLARRLGINFCLYGDPIFARSTWLQKGFPRIGRTHRRELFNRQMNSARISIEHIFGLVVKYWAYVDFAKQQKLHVGRLGPHVMYLNAQFMLNCYTCMYKQDANQVITQFDCEPPDIDEYIAMNPEAADEQ